MFKKRCRRSLLTGELGVSPRFKILLNPPFERGTKGDWDYRGFGKTQAEIS
jgi:hypothetical protein